MKIVLSLKEKDVILVLSDGDKVVQKKEWIDENNLLEQFFPSLDEILRAEGLGMQDIDDFVLETNIPKGYTTARIARTIIKSLNFARSV